MSERSRHMSVLEARAAAQRLAFGPMMFQAVRVLWKTGTLARIEAAAEDGIDAATLARETGISEYGIKVLCDASVSAGIIAETGPEPEAPAAAETVRYRITKTGSVLLHDRLTQVNVNFVHDVCYQGMHALETAIREGRPAGLAVFSDADTIYRCVPSLPEQARSSWYAFDHYYSDRAFDEAAEIVFSRPTRRLLDIGGNTGRWTRHCLRRSPDVAVTIADLPGQLDAARDALGDEPEKHRVSYHPVDLLSAAPKLPEGFDAVWMSQFLDCFSEPEIGAILDVVRPALTEQGRVYILETLVDRQRFEAAAYSLNAISLYFTALANGSSRMYRGTTLERILGERGFTVTACHDHLGIGHTLLECRPG